MSQWWIQPDWPAQPGIRAYSTLRAGGVSQGAYASLNLAAHVGDDPAHVAANRHRLREGLQLPAEPYWLTQVHGNKAVRASAKPDPQPEADASFSDEPGVVCAVMTADCLPVLFCDREGIRVAASHAGWRGLAAGVLESTVQALGGSDLMAWLGPSIGAKAFEVGGEVRQSFSERLGDCDGAFLQIDELHWLADLYSLARMTLARVGVTEIYGGDECTFSNPRRFFSYRRDSQTGRMATLIWRE
ncbi:MAG: peptidoglycan editing factor PgeF [Candidatus Methylumidiphilus alinenensis]|uniref:Purine nucleoside phosphorylase n=1 Tax=Candidatus Methylumidiphilus alinenensis TaxID=2202197 RepID=A0A2W4TFZ7_9GAMM|nr:MAG: peptidoglycan editing factor PgeF [Candidatus Methylumidiphilus alinenensis]